MRTAPPPLLYFAPFLHLVSPPPTPPQRLFSLSPPSLSSQSAPPASGGASLTLPSQPRLELGYLLLLVPELFSSMSRFRSLWKSSIQATKRALKGNWEDMLPPTEKCVFHFNSKDQIEKWHLYSDSELGGLSSAALEITDIDSGAPLAGVFSGNLSLDLDDGSPWRMNRSGFCGMRSKRFDGFIDLESYDTIAMRLRGDGRCYISTIYTENWVNSPGQPEDNSWQSFVYVPKDSWHVTKIPLDRYLPTWRGNVINANLEMNPSRIVGMALSVNAEGGVPGARAGPGNFRLEIDWIKALRS